MQPLPPLEAGAVTFTKPGEYTYISKEYPWQKAQMIALCDAMVQSAELAGAIETQVVAPLRAAMIERRNRKVAEAAATRVDFYTLVRGEG